MQESFKYKTPKTNCPIPYENNGIFTNVQCAPGIFISGKLIT